jgi:hypothetical protein
MSCGGANKLTHTMKKLLLLAIGVGLLLAGTVSLQASLLGAPKTQLSDRHGTLDIDVTIEGGSAIISKSATGDVITALVFDNNGLCQLVALFNANPNATSSFDAMERTVTGSVLKWEPVPANTIKVAPLGTICRFSVSDGTYIFAVDGTQSINGRQYAYRIYTSAAGAVLAQQLNTASALK